MTRRSPLPMLLLLGLAPVGLAAQVSPPPGWLWHHDVRGASADSAGWRFDMMPPGFHLTTTAAGVTLTPADSRIAGRRAAEARVILFPGKGSGAYGLGIADLDAPGSWTGLLVRRDGTVALATLADGRETLQSPWQGGEGIVTPDSTGYATNVFRIEIGGGAITWLANGKRLMVVERPTLPRAAEVAFRMGAGLNMHITIFDLITPLAPIAARRSP